MKTCEFPTMGEPAVFTLTPTDEGYHVAKYCHLMDLLFYNLNTTGIVIQQAEESDFTTAETAFDGLSDNLKLWADGALVASSNGTAPDAFDPAMLPDILTFVALLVTQNWGAIFLLFVKVGLRAVVDVGRKKLDPDIATGDLIEFLTAAIAVKDESGAVVGTRLEGLANLQVQINNILSQGEADALYSVKAMQE